MKIRQASQADLLNAKKLTEACAVGMKQLGIFQWNEHYPSIEKLQQDIDLKELYILEVSNQFLGIIVLSEKMDEEYIPVSWISPSEKNLYIHRLATHPSSWGKGYGQKLMDFAEEFARNLNYTSIRLDTFSLNKRNQKFYETRGYQKLEDIYFPKQSAAPFHCYELVLKKNSL
ncbi:ribosomal protein S18 acetylase RimI-like enzyme [Gillisia mitskevichiae]|uniref:Ribosomal protein S18 acetylase RimI-like enzyme n=1 Tax=Gillisia mitskevichiae TaxID=270921 RepID=A0A495PY19_9FLAO|nr:GNAT family N-acetyltransferase [Gillisia mitskevichiae]RKS55316.1 ribosomal protein S18 acetylase RimI-like enzyme [Gillisia mitskevichiae]